VITTLFCFISLCFSSSFSTAACLRSISTLLSSLLLRFIAVKIVSLCVIKSSTFVAVSLISASACSFMRGASVLLYISMASRFVFSSLVRHTSNANGSRSCKWLRIRSFAAAFRYWISSPITVSETLSSAAISVWLVLPSANISKILPRRHAIWSFFLLYSFSSIACSIF
jgi:hypothetical protein